jgi:hypothetical protein
MTRDDIICMARVAGAERNSDFPDWSFDDDQIERFAALVAAAEREACADLCDLGRYLRGWECAASIRARSQS